MFIIIRYGFRRPLSPSPVWFVVVCCCLCCCLSSEKIMSRMSIVQMHIRIWTRDSNFVWVPSGPVQNCQNRSRPFLVQTCRRNVVNTSPRWRKYLRLDTTISGNTAHLAHSHRLAHSAHTAHTAQFCFETKVLFRNKRGFFGAGSA